MEIEFTQTASDYIKAYKHISKHLNASTKWRYLASLSGFVFGLLLVFGVISIAKFYEKYSFINSEELNFGLSAITIAVVILVVGIKIYNTKIRSLIFEENGLYKSPQKFKIKQEFLLQYMGDNQHRYQWKYVKEIEKTSEYIYLFLDRGAALYIPRHGFASNEKYQEFYEDLQLYAKQYR
jgi:predicted membrane channel-forming protein YqfA (hemolysin III family)